MRHMFKKQYARRRILRAERFWHRAHFALRIGPGPRPKALRSENERLTGCAPPTIPASMPCGDVIAAVRVVETLLDRAAAPMAAQD
jgi:hypothetical protein